MKKPDTITGEAFGGSVRTDAETGDFTILGIPFDEKSTFRKGTAGGPDAVRRVSTVRSINSWTESGADLAEDTVIADAGNIRMEGSVEEYFAAISGTVAGIAAKNSIPVCIGGDHSITFPVVRGMKQVYRELNIVWLDAHPDNYPEFNGDPLSHACPLARILELDGIGKVWQGGVRASTGKLNEMLDNAGVISADINNLDKIKGLSLSGKTYLSIDIDVLDPAFAPGVGNPVAAGLSTRELISLIHSFDLDIAGFDVVEVNPGKDCSDITAVAAAKILMEIMGRITVLNRK